MRRTKALRGFLLGTLSETDRGALENALLVDDDLYERLLAVEEELVQESVRGELSPEREASFLRYLAKTPDGAERLAFARALQASLAPATSRPMERDAQARPWLLRGASLAWAASLAVLLLGGLAAAVLTLRARVDDLSERIAEAEAREAELVTRRSESDDSRRSVEQAEGHVESPPSTPRQREPGMIPVLTAGILRGSGKLPELSIAQGETAFRVSLDLAADSHESYRAVLFDMDARERVAVSRLTAQSDAESVRVSLTFPTAGLEPGDYYIRLSGSTSSGEHDALARYDFRLRFR